MKTIFCSFFVLLAAASCSLAQPPVDITVTLTVTGIGGSSCTFKASHVVEGMTAPAGPQGALMKMTIEKNVDQCNNSLIADIFRSKIIAPPMLNATIAISQGTTLATYALRNVAVTSFSDDVLGNMRDATGKIVPTETGTATLTYDAISVNLSPLNISYTCTSSLRTCS